MANARGLGRLSTSIWLKLAALAVAGTVLVALGPRLAGDGSRPPVTLLLFIGLLLIAAAGAAMYGAVRLDLGFPSMVAWYAVGYNVLLILVKFVFGPFGLYEVNQSVDFEAFFPVTEVAGAMAAASAVFVLYVSVYLLVYWLATRVQRRLKEPGWVKRLRDKMVANRRAVLLIVGGALMVSATAGTGLLLVMLLAAESGGVYIDFVFSSSGSLFVAVFLASATILVGLHFRDAVSQESLVVGAAGAASLLWLGLCFIALYHMLWVVYILVLTSIWPLRTVVPK